jgi:hypothetical protein
VTTDCHWPPAFGPPASACGEGAWHPRLMTTYCHYPADAAPRPGGGAGGDPPLPPLPFLFSVRGRRGRRGPRGSHGTGRPSLRHNSRAARWESRLRTLAYRSSASPRILHLWQYQARGDAAKLREPCEVEPWMGHGPRRCPPQPPVGTQPIRSRTSRRDIRRLKALKSIPGMLHHGTEKRNGKGGSGGSPPAPSPAVRFRVPELHCTPRNGAIAPLHPCNGAPGVNLPCFVGF